jgi:type II secretory pathway component PulF
MPAFEFQARSRDGESQTGQVEASDRRSALQRIQSKGLTPVSVKEVEQKPGSKKAAKPKANTDITIPKGGIKLPTRIVLQFSMDVRDLLNAGMTLGAIIQKLSRQSGSPQRSAVLKKVHEDIVQGKSLSEALAKHPRSFPDFYVSLVRAGEASGQLQDSLQNAVRHYERAAEARDQVIGALVYPVIVLVAGIIVIIFCMIKVVPQFTEIFASMDQALPLPTKILMGGSDFLVVYGPLLLGIHILLVLGFFRWKRTVAGRLAWHGFLLKVPVINRLIRSAAFANFARTLSNLMMNGVPVLHALDIVKKTANNAVLEREIAKLKDRVTDGSSLSRPLAESGVFPDLFTDMLSVGEEAGQVPRSLAQIAERYDEELTRNIKVMTSLIEPLLMVLIAGAVGFVAISMLLPIFSLTQGIR